VDDFVCLYIYLTRKAVRVKMRISIIAREDVMPLDYNKSAEKKNVNLSANADLVRLAKERKINLSALFEESLVESLQREELKRWKEESQESFESYNRMVAEHGLLSDDMGLL